MQSARLGLHGDHDNVVKLRVDHRQVCKFRDSQTDQDNLELVRSNIRDLYKNALKLRELNTTPFVVDQHGNISDKGSLQE